MCVEQHAHRLRIDELAAAQVNDEPPGVQRQGLNQSVPESVDDRDVHLALHVQNDDGYVRDRDAVADCRHLGTSCPSGLSIAGLRGAEHAVTCQFDDKARQVAADVPGRGRMCKMRTVMLVEDDSRIRAALTLALEDEGYQVAGVATAEAALERQTTRPASTILMDLMLPGLSGLDCIRELRRFSDVPIVVVSARDDTHDVVAALEVGADDYLVKPVEIKELSARMRAVTRRVRAGDRSPPGHRLGNLEIYPERGEVLLDGAAISLTRTEFRLLCELAALPGQVLSRAQLLRAVWE